MRIAAAVATGILLLLPGCRTTTDRLERYEQDLARVARWPRTVRAGEVRLFLEHGLLVPTEVIRVVRSRGRTTVDVVSWWPNEPGVLHSVHPEPPHRTFEDLQREACPNVRTGGTVMLCLRKLPDDRAAEVYDELTRLGVWSLRPPREPLPGETLTITLHSEVLRVQFREGGKPRELYSTLEADDHRYDAAAARIARFCAKVAGIAPESSEER